MTIVCIATFVSDLARLLQVLMMLLLLDVVVTPIVLLRLGR